MDLSNTYQNFINVIGATYVEDSDDNEDYHNQPSRRGGGRSPPRNQNAAVYTDQLEPGSSARQVQQMNNDTSENASASVEESSS